MARPVTLFTGQWADLKLEPQTEYKISGWVQAQNETVHLFAFNFHTDSEGRPAAF